MVRVPVVWREISCESVRRAREVDEGVDPRIPDKIVILDHDEKEAVVASGDRVEYCFPRLVFDLAECDEWIEHECYDITEHIKQCLNKQEEGA